MVGLEEFDRLARSYLAVVLGDDALHRPLVVFIGALDIEELEARPLARLGRAPLDLRQDPAVEEVLAPAIGVEGHEACHILGPRVVAEAAGPVAIGRGGGGIYDGDVEGGAVVPEADRQPEVILED